MLLLELLHQQNIECYKIILIGQNKHFGNLHIINVLIIKIGQDQLKFLDVFNMLIQLHI